MRVVLDTNVLVSGIFWSGPPYDILKSWQAGKFTLLISPDILDEYRRVSTELGKKFPRVELDSILDFVTYKAHICTPPLLTLQVCEDRDDDKFIACALAGKAKCLVSGDLKLLSIGSYQGLEILKPKAFVGRYLSG